MSGAKVSKKLIDMLSEFLVTEIQGKALGGITYTLLFKDGKDKEMCAKYFKIREEATNCGFGPNEVFRVYEVTNGYIFDMDLSVAKYITVELSKAVAKMNGGKTPVGDLIGEAPEKRRREDLKLLAKYLQGQFKEGRKDVEVALFSRNSVPRIVINAVDKAGNPILLKYNAYAIRHWDIEDVNTALLLPVGIRIASIEPCEILPSKTGVRFIVRLAPVGK